MVISLFSVILPTRHINSFFVQCFQQQVTSPPSVPGSVSRRSPKIHTVFCFIPNIVQILWMICLISNLEMKNQYPTSKLSQYRRIINMNTPLYFLFQYRKWTISNLWHIQNNCPSRSTFRAYLYHSLCRQTPKIWKQYYAKKLIKVYKITCYIYV